VAFSKDIYIIAGNGEFVKNKLRVINLLANCGVLKFVMFVTKCDKCKKEIQREAVYASVTVSFNRYAFCSKCGKPVLDFLNKLDKKENGKQKRAAK